MNVGLCVRRIEGKGGIQKNYLLWFRMFKKRGIPATLFVLEPSSIREEGIVYLQGRTKREKQKALSNALRETHFDLFLLNAEYFKHILQRAQQPYYITVHNTWMVQGPFWKRWKQQHRLRKKYQDERLIGISRSVLDNITETLHIPVKSTKIVYAPHDFTLVREKAADISIGEPFIVTVGSLIKRKNHAFVIEAFAKIAASVPHHLYIVGDGSEETHLRTLIEQRGLSSRIKLLGYQENPYPYIKNADLLVSGSLSEGLPRVVVEALVLHTPVVTSYSSQGIDEVMVGALAPFVVKTYDTACYAEKILEALEYYPEITPDYYQKFSEENGFVSFCKLCEG